MRRPLVLVLAFAAVGLVLALVFVERERADAPSVENTRAVFEPAADAQLTVRAPVSAQPASGVARSESVASAGDAEPDAPQRHRAGLACDGPTLVVQASEPIAGAEVRWIANTRAFKRVENGWFADPDAGERFVTDASGRVRVPLAEHGARVHVTAGELAGDAHISPLAQGEVKVVVSRKETIHVRVVDTAGVPARGVRVVLRMHDGTYDMTSAMSETTSDGRAVLEYFAGHLPPGSRLSVEADLVLPKRLLVPVERASSPLDPIVVTLPALGSVQVAIFGPDGIDTDANGRVSLWSAALESETSMPSRGLVLREGVARATSIGLGTQLGALVTIDTLPWPVELHGTGPVRAGEEALLALRVAELPWIRFRLLGVDGDPIRGGTLGLQFVSGESRRAVRIATDANAVLRLPLTDVWSAGDARHAQINVAGLGQAFVDLAREFPPGTTDLGDVHIGDGPRIAAGRVVDEQGEPLSNARVQLVRFDHESQSERLPSAGLPRIATGLDGTFELIGLTDPDVYGLRVTASGYVTARRPLVIGEKGLVITLAEYGSIRGNLVFTGELTPENVELWLADGAGFSRKIEVESKGFFRAVDVAPGMWELRVSRAKSEDVLARVGGIELAAGGRVELDPLEVRERGEVTK